jgi:hypothetical protein
MAQSVLEKKVEERLVALLDAKGIFHYKGRPAGLKGYPDRVIFSDKIYHVEVKVGKALGSYYKQTPTQKFWQTKFEASQGEYRLLTGFEEVEAFAATLPSQIKESD